MDINISKKLKELRAIKGNTQEDIALFIGISTQAVSKWERGEGYPDITLLPKIASYYQVSVDSLLGCDALTKEERIKEVLSEYRETISEEGLDEESIAQRGIFVLRRALKELPGEFNLEQLLASNLFWKAKYAPDDEKLRLYGEAIELCRDVLGRCTEHIWRSCALEILLCIYADMGRQKEALELAYQLPGPFTTCDYLLTHILEGDDLKYRYKLNAVLYYRVFRESVLRLLDMGVDKSDIPDKDELLNQGIFTDDYEDCIDAIISAAENPMN